MRFDVWLVAFEPGKAPAKAIAETYGIDMQEALTLELTLPTIVARDKSEGAASRAVLELRAIGGRAEARPMDPKAPFGFDLPFTESGWDDEPAPDVPPPSSATEGQSDKLVVKEIGPAGGHKDLSLPKVRGLPKERGPPKVRRSEEGGSGEERGSEEAPAMPKERGANRAEVALDVSPTHDAAKRPRPQRDIPLQVVDVEPPRRGRAQQRAEAAASDETGGGLDLARFLPVAGAAALAVGALYLTLWRGQTGLLGTADLLGLGIDTVAFASAAIALLLVGVLFFTKREILDAGPGFVVVVLCAGAAYGLNNVGAPVVGAESEVGDEAEGLISQNDVHFVGLNAEAIQQLINSMRQAGAISIRGAAPVRIFGSTAYHALAVSLPPGPTARARIGEVYRNAMAQAGTTTQLNPPAEAQNWIVPLSGR